MGNEASQNSQDHILPTKEDPSAIFADSHSSYKGMKTDTNTTDKHKSKSISTISDNNKETVSMPQETKVQITFEWKEGGDKVTWTGSFLNWNNFIEMHKNQATNRFELTLSLPLGVHQFKFVVDNNWRYSNNYPQLKDNCGNINNVIDTTTVPNEQSKAGKQNNNVDNSNNTTNSQSPSPGKKARADVRKSKVRNDYTSYLPKQNEMNTDAPQIPWHYLHTHNIDHFTNQKTLGSDQYLAYMEKNWWSENNSYKKILICPHVNWNHQCSSCLGPKDRSIFGGGIKAVKTCVAQRIRHKYISVVYYNRKNSY